MYRSFSYKQDSVYHNTLTLAAISILRWMAAAIAGNSLAAYPEITSDNLLTTYNPSGWTIFEDRTQEATPVLEITLRAPISGSSEYKYIQITSTGANTTNNFTFKYPVAHNGSAYVYGTHTGNTFTMTLLATGSHAAASEFRFLASARYCLAYVGAAGTGTYMSTGGTVGLLETVPEYWQGSQAFPPTIAISLSTSTWSAFVAGLDWNGNNLDFAKSQVHLNNGPAYVFDAAQVRKTVFLNQRFVGGGTGAGEIPRSSGRLTASDIYTVRNCLQYSAGDTITGPLNKQYTFVPMANFGSSQQPMLAVPRG